MLLVYVLVCLTQQLTSLLYVLLCLTQQLYVVALCSLCLTQQLMSLLYVLLCLTQQLYSYFKSFMLDAAAVCCCFMFSYV